MLFVSFVIINYKTGIMSQNLDFIIRLIVASLLGVIIGLEREYRSKEAGYRTHFLVALGSALMMIVSQYGFNDVLSKDLVRLDPSRLAAQVVTGIGFIGAGTIILLQKQVIRGLTTAAGIWATSGIGLAVGAGMYRMGIVTTVLFLIGVEVLNYFFKGISLRSMIVEFTTANEESLKKISALFSSKGFLISSYEMEEKTDIKGNHVYSVSIVVKAKNMNEEGILLMLLHDFPEITVNKIM